MKLKRTDHFGVHEAPNGMFYLIQDDEQNIRGLNVKSYIKVVPWRNGQCPHDIRLVSDGLLSAHDRSVLGALDLDPLGRLLLPRWDNSGTVVFLDEKESVYPALSEWDMALGGVEGNKSAAWLMTIGEARRESRLTNIAPYIIYSVTPAWLSKEGEKIVEIFRNGTRPLILVGRRDVVLPNHITRVENHALMDLTNLEQPKLAGATYLKERMRDAES